MHVAAVLDHLGALLGTGAFPATAADYRQLLDWVSQCGTVVRAGVECTDSYGAGLARYLATQRVAVVEVNQPDRSTRRRRGKTDAIDAEAATRAALWGTAHALPKSGEGEGGSTTYPPAGEELRGQGAHPGAQPAQGSAGKRSIYAARGAGAALDLAPGQPLRGASRPPR
ncbi:transposase [Streptomyces europaeiscabiei]|nr:transposase [Streptomyces europaeiscabiei]MDX3784703.1 transposase [Streptomyces europaeiscabiei]